MIEYNASLSEFYGGLPLIKRQGLPQGLVSAEWQLAFGQTLLATTTTEKTFYETRPASQSNIITNISQYTEIYDFFMNNYGTTLPDSAKPQGFWSRDNTTDPRLSVDERWNNDDVFSQSRLMGVNPVEIERVTESESVGMEWKALEAMLNSTFNWNEAVSAVIPDVNSIEEVRNFPGIKLIMTTEKQSWAYTKIKINSLNIAFLILIIVFGLHSRS